MPRWRPDGKSRSVCRSLAGHDRWTSIAGAEGGEQCLLPRLARPRRTRGATSRGRSRPRATGRGRSHDLGRGDHVAHSVTPRAATANCSPVGNRSPLGIIRSQPLRHCAHAVPPEGLRSASAPSPWRAGRSTIARRCGIVLSRDERDDAASTERRVRAGAPRGPAHLGASSLTARPLTPGRASASHHRRRADGRAKRQSTVSRVAVTVMTTLPLTVSVYPMRTPLDGS